MVEQQGELLSQRAMRRRIGPVSDMVYTPSAEDYMKSRALVMQLLSDKRLADAKAFDLEIMLRQTEGERDELRSQNTVLKHTTGSSRSNAGIAWFIGLLAALFIGIGSNLLTQERAQVYGSVFIVAGLFLEVMARVLIKANRQ